MMKKTLLAISLAAILVLGFAAVAFAQQAVYDGPAKKDGDPKTGHYCTNPDDHHPALYRLAQQYNTPYEKVLSWFCDGRFGVGEIKHAFETSVAVDGRYSPEQILAMKVEMGGWGKVWQFLELRGNGNDHGNGNSNSKKDSH
jgi:hypothetical protein